MRRSYCLLVCLSVVAGCASGGASELDAPALDDSHDSAEGPADPSSYDPNAGGGGSMQSGGQGSSNAVEQCTDADLDGYGAGCSAGPDCNPGNASVHPGVEELCFDRVDNNCDGIVDADCDCTSATSGCDEPPVVEEQTLGEVVFGLSRGAMLLDASCGRARIAALDQQRTAIIANFDTLVTTTDILNVAQVATEVLVPVLKSGDLEDVGVSFAKSVGLLLDSDFDPERRALSVLSQLTAVDLAVDRDHVFSIIEQALADARLPELFHALTGLAAHPVGGSTLAEELMGATSALLKRESATLACSGLSVAPLAARMLDASVLSQWVPEGGPALIKDLKDPEASIDVSRTGLGLVMEVARDALDADVHRDATVLIEAALGATTSCGAGCVSYPSNNLPLADAAHVGLDLLRFEQTRALLGTFNVLLRDKPEVAENLLVTVGKLAKVVRAADIDLDQDQVVRLVRDLLPLLERVFASNGKTPRLLLSVLHDLGKTARAMPAQLKNTIDYVTLFKSPTCSMAAPNLSRSTPVNYAAARGGSNRSGLEQVIELLAATNCGTVPFTGKTVGVFMLDTMSGMRPDTVCGLTDFLLGALNVTGGLGDLLAQVALTTIGCSNASAVVNNLDSLESLAASGALDFMLPVVKIFADQGQLPTLMAILEIVRDDLALDNDSSASTKSVFRQLEPVLSTLIAQGTFDSLFDLTDVLVTVKSTDSAGKAATLSDILIDSVAFVVTRRSVPTRAGTVQSSYAAELLKPVEVLATRISAGAAQASLTNVADFGLSYLDADASGKLKNRALLPFAQLLLDGIVEVWSLPQSVRTCYVDGLTSDIDTLFVSPELAKLVTVLRGFREAPESALFEQVLVDFLSPPVVDGPNVRVPLLQVAAELLQSDLSAVEFSNLVPFLAQVIDPNVTDGPALLRVLDTIIQSDDKQVFLGMARKAFASDGPTGQRPLSALLDGYGAALGISGEMCLAQNGALSTDGLVAPLSVLLGLLNDSGTGLPALFDLLLGFLSL